MPKAAWKGTTIATTIAVRPSAESESSSVTASSQWAGPSRSASTATTVTGRTSRTKTLARAIARTLIARAPRGRSRGLCATAGQPPLECVDREQEPRRRDQHGERDDGGARVVVALEVREDAVGRDLAVLGAVAGDEDDRAVLAERARES